MKKSIKNKQERLIFPNLGELIDSLTIYQIKEAKLTKNNDKYLKHLLKISHDIDLIFDEKQIKLSSKLIRMIVVLAQINLSIWHLKDHMQEDPKKYMESLKKAHQLNGIRNKIKNKLAQIGDRNNNGDKHTNLSTDNLEDWKISI